MNEPNTIEQRLAEIARVLSMSTDALLSLSTADAAYPASFEAEASEIASNFRICDADARQLLLHLSRTLAEKSQYP